MYLFPDYKFVNAKSAKPFLKWAGGKSQLLSQFIPYLPKELDNNEIENYYEPFLGSGAVFFFLNSQYKFRHSFLFDVNEQLVNSYNVIKDNLEELVKYLEVLQKKYFSLRDEKREDYFYGIRDNFNSIITNKYSVEDIKTKVKMTSHLIFLNKTCFNGLFRMNRKGEFNVPFGRYKNPKILDGPNLRLVNRLLQNTTIQTKSFNESLLNIHPNSFVYLDPPYLPLNKTSSFTSYSKEDFTLNNQIELSLIFKELSNKKDIWLMLSNSDPKNENSSNNFFEENFMNKQININRVYASRMINCDSSKRGKITELIIRNYQ